MMKRQLFIFVLALLAVPVFASTNEVRGARGARSANTRPAAGRDNEERGDRKRKERRRDISPEMQLQLDERRLQLMERTLKEIGVTEGQKARILELQSRLREGIKKRDRQVSEARRKVTVLQNEGATEEVIFAAIDELTAAQGEKMKALVRDQLEMKRILGEEKYSAFMDCARVMWREHDRRGSGLPSKPELPPTPNRAKDPPMPNRG